MLSPDAGPAKPILFAGGDLNLYGYCIYDPVNLIDPSGTILPFVAAGAVAAWELFEVAMSAWDIISLLSDAFNPCVSWGEFGGPVRHGKGYHVYNNSNTAGAGNGPRSEHIPF